MGWLRRRAERAEKEPWAQPFGPPPAADSVTINPMVKMAAQLAGTLVIGEPAAEPPAASSAATAATHHAAA